MIPAMRGVGHKEALVYPIDGRRSHRSKGWFESREIPPLGVEWLVMPSCTGTYAIAEGSSMNSVEGTMATSLTAQDIMNPEVMSVQDDLTVAELAAFLVDQEISGAPVRDELGKLVGVVSVTDIVRTHSSDGERYAPDHDPGFYVRGWEDRVEVEELQGYHFEDDSLLVRDIMTPSVFAVEVSTPVREVARSMMDSHLHRILVVNDGEVVGIVSTSDMLQMVVEAC